MHRASAWPWLALVAISCAETPVREPSTALVVAPVTGTRAPATRSAPPRAKSEAGCGVALLQAEKTLKLVDSRRYRIERAPFVLRFELEHYTDAHWHAARIAVSERPRLLELAPGPIDDESNPFGPGTGLAFGATGYDVMEFRDDAHHYVYVTSNGEGRARVVRPLGPGRSEVEVDVKAFFWLQTGLHYPIARLPIDRIYLAIFFDRDLDSVIAADELCRFALELPHLDADPK